MRDAVEKKVQRIWPRKRLLALALVVAVLAGGTTGCGVSPTHTPRGSNLWSNGALLGTAGLNQTAPLQVDEAGNGFLVWTDPEHQLVLTRLDEQAQVVFQTVLPLQSTGPLKPGLLLDPAGQLHLIWLDRGRVLSYARLSSDGEVLQDTTFLSSPSRRAAYATMTLAADNQTIEIFWSDRLTMHPGCYHAALDLTGAVIVPEELLIPAGLYPAAQADRQGMIHLAWRTEEVGSPPTFHYAVYDPVHRALGPATTAAEPAIQAGLLGGPTANVRFDGPWLGLDPRSAYLAWTSEAYDRGQRRTSTFYVAFPLPTPRWSPERSALEYDPPGMPDEVVLVEGSDPTLTGDPAFLPGQPETQRLAVHSLVSSPSLEMLQIVVADLAPDRVTDQVVVNRSRAASLRPTPALGPQGDLYLSWIDTAGFEQYQVVYASTSPQVRETLNRVTTYDVVDRVMSTLTAVISLLLYTPIVIVWMLLPLGWLIFFSLATSNPDLAERSGRLALGVAIALHLVAERAISGGLFARSFLPPVWSLWIAPLLLAAGSALLMWLWLKRKGSLSPFAAYFLFAGLDSFLVLFLYVALPMAWGW